MRSVRIEHSIAIVEPYWTTKNETINRVRKLIELVRDWASERQFRTGDNPARWQGNLDKLLAVPSMVAPVVGNRALPAGDLLFEFIQRLSEVPGTSARCLEFVVLVTCRSGEARLATWAEIDLATKTWRIPGERTKSGKAHSVPLSAETV